MFLVCLCSCAEVFRRVHTCHLQHWDTMDVTPQAEAFSCTPVRSALSRPHDREQAKQWPVSPEPAHIHSDVHVTDRQRGEATRHAGHTARRWLHDGPGSISR